MEIAFSDPCRRLERYIRNVDFVIKRLRVLDTSALKVVELARAYLEDSKYYAAKGDCITGLVTISYAEGLLDALRFTNSVDFVWPSGKPFEEKTVLAAGSFDIVHPGHIAYLRWASSLGTKLLVVVSRDSTYRRIKGRDPVMDEKSRLEVIRALRYVYEARLGNEGDMLRIVEELKPCVIALGPDQPIDEEWLKEELRRRGLSSVAVIRMSSRVGSFSSSSIRKRIVDVLCREFID